jgi:preprotein translocase subunit SecB
MEFEMSETEDNTENKPSPNMPVYIKKQYVKDLSFENPHAPDVLKSAENPEMQARFNLGASILDEENNVYEVVLGVTARAMRGDTVAFIAEIAYGMEVVLADVPEEKVHPMLYIEMPRQAFPFVRQIIANLTQMGGYSPLLMRPVDFRALYMDRFSENITQVNPEEKEEMVKADA